MADLPPPNLKSIYYCRLTYYTFCSHLCLLSVFLLVRSFAWHGFSRGLIGVLLGSYFAFTVFQQIFIYFFGCEPTQDLGLLPISECLGFTALDDVVVYVCA